MGFISKFKTLPTPLIIVFAAFCVMPGFSFFIAANPFLSALSQGPLRGSVILLAYWVLPFIICSLCYRRSFVMIPIFFIECGLLLLHSILDMQYQPADIQLVRYFLLLGMTVFTVTFLNRDVVYPLLAGNARAWRSAPRLRVQVPMLLWYTDEPNTRLPVVLHNCSLTGIGISGPKDVFKTLLHEKENVGAFVIQIGFGSKNWMLNVQLIRRREEAAILYAGFKVLNSEVMVRMMEEVQALLPPQKTLRGMISQYWVRRGFRHAVLALWAVSMASVFMMPSCAHVEYREVYPTRERGQAPITGTAPQRKLNDQFQAVQTAQNSTKVTENLPAWRSRALGCVP